LLIGNSDLEFLIGLVKLEFPINIAYLIFAKSDNSINGRKPLEATETPSMHNSYIENNYITPITLQTTC
jgi:hypothetical protein